MKYSDIQHLSKQELVKKRSEIQEDLFQSRMKNSLGQLSNPVQMRFMRRDLARVATAMASQRIAQEKTK